MTIEKLNIMLAKMYKHIVFINNEPTKPFYEQPSWKWLIEQYGEPRYSYDNYSTDNNRYICRNKNAVWDILENDDVGRASFKYAFKTRKIATHFKLVWG